MPCHALFYPAMPWKGNGRIVRVMFYVNVTREKQTLAMYLCSTYVVILGVDR